MSELSLLEELDQMRRELQNDYPGWQIWYVFHRDAPPTWHARPNPWFNAPSPDDLRKLIGEATSLSTRPPALTVRGKDLRDILAPAYEQLAANDREATDPDPG